MSTIDTSTWNPDANLNTEIEGIPLNADSSVAQTWQALRILMAAVKGDGDAIKAMIDVMQGATASADGASGLVPKPEAGDQDKVLKGDGTWGTISASDIPNIDASKIISGTIDLARLPAGALERLVTVTDQTARFALTTADVQLGDTVKQLDTGVMYIVVDASKLGQIAGYVEYTAGSAASVPWSGVTGKPSDFTPSSHTHGSVTNDGKLSTASRAVVTDGNKAIDVSSVTATELGYLSGVTSAVQTQLDGKASDSGVVHSSSSENIDGVKTFKQYIRCDNSSEQRGITGTSSATSFIVGAANSVNSGAHIQLYGKDNSSNAGSFVVTASIGSGSSNRKALQGTASGTLSWVGQPIQTSSDERLKTPLSAVPDKVLDAWEDVNWGQFQFLEAVQEKGGYARLHLGLIAQKVKAVFEARGLDACVYGILCHDEEDDLWMVRYEEALAMEATFQRRRADRLEARVAALEEKLNG